MSNVQGIYNDIASKIDQFKADAEKFLAGNKTAGTRSRKASLELTKLMKEWRKMSVAQAKGVGSSV